MRRLRLRRCFDGDNGGGGDVGTAAAGMRAAAAVSLSAAAVLWCLGGGPQRAGLTGGLPPLFRTSPPAALRQTPPRRVTLQVLAADLPSLRRRSVPAISSETGGFVDLIVPQSAQLSRNGRAAGLAQVRPGDRLVCRGVWADAAKTTFRVAQITVGPAVGAEELSRRVAAACQRVTSRRERESAAASMAEVRRAAAVTPPALAAAARKVGAEVTDGFVVEGLSLERAEEEQAATTTAPAVAPAPGAPAEPPPPPGYAAAGLLRNVSGAAYAAVEVQASVFDGRGRKVADQTALLRNLRPGDRVRFRCGPAAALPFRAGHSARIDRVVVARP